MKRRAKPDSTTPLSPFARAETDARLIPDGAIRLVSLPTEPGEWPRALSPSEREVARLLISGCSHEEIARLRGVSPETVSAQVRAMRRKLGVDSASRLIAYLARYGEESDS